VFIGEMMGAGVEPPIPLRGILDVVLLIQLLVVELVIFEIIFVFLRNNF
jgi:hypothetical protein